ncbi:DUF2271 domain-containing protein [Nannocystaceae bacterium ST9]
MSVLASCYQPEVEADYVPLEGGAGWPSEWFASETSTDESDEADAETQGCPHAGESPLVQLSFTVRTSAVGGQFAPRNVGAIWIEDGEGVFVRTLERWGIMRAKWLLRFNEASEGDVTDAITGATLPAHETHVVDWDLRDLSGCEVANGEYDLVIELTDRSGAGESIAIPFAKDLVGGTLMPREHTNFHDMVLVLE